MEEAKGDICNTEEVMMSIDEEEGCSVKQMGVSRRRRPVFAALIPGLVLVTFFVIPAWVQMAQLSESSSLSEMEFDASRATIDITSSHPAGSDLVARSGGDASQTGKATWAASDPVRIAEWWLDLLPTSPWMLGNITSDGGCATYGKVFVGNGSTTGIHGVNAPFQLHAVRAYRRPAGPMSIELLESAFGRALDVWGYDDDRKGGSDIETNFAYQVHALAPLAEHLVALYTEDLNYYARALTKVNTPFSVLEWDGATRDASLQTSSAKFHSLVVHIPDSLVVLELVGPAMDSSTKASQRASASWRRVAMALPPATHVATNDVQGRPTLTAVKISYASTDAGRDAQWVTNVLDAHLLDNSADSKDFPPSSFDDDATLTGSKAFGVVTKVLSWTSDMAPIELHFVQPSLQAQSIEQALTGRIQSVKQSGPPTKEDLAHQHQGPPLVRRNLLESSKEQTVILTVASYESYIDQVHAAYVGPNCENCDDVTGFDRLLDTHFGRRLLSGGGEEARTIDSAYLAAKSLGSPLTIWKKNDAYFLYAAAPNGAAVQLVGFFDNPPSGVRSYSTCLV
uniref:Uncharacterized protein n=1 Tax=Aureoumbra lagunensis TaxID=44058 RepID=A0A7S3NKB2_9STRA|mmetsp:Transcript_22344/g.28903  ORF Transcript_22344/g.28903 Transcript_22344/m.28903 type:complete len:568 (+) Transcript_22344:51-1754(+)